MKNNGEDLVDFRVAMAKHIFRFKRDIFDYISDSEGVNPCLLTVLFRSWCYKRAVWWIFHFCSDECILHLGELLFESISVDEQDKRKQRIELTDYCQEFCEKNDEMSRALLKRLFAGVSEE